MVIKRIALSKALFNSKHRVSFDPAKKISAMHYTDLLSTTHSSQTKNSTAVGSTSCYFFSD